MKRTAFLFLSLMASALPGGADPVNRRQAGQNQIQGQRQDRDGGKQEEPRRGWNLDVAVDFSQSFGTTRTDGTGIYYYLQDGTLLGSESKIYAPQYWGSWPMYFFGLPVAASISVTNRGPRRFAKIQVVAEAFDMRLDGGNGVQLLPPRVYNLKIPRGETRKLDDTFIVNMLPGADSGLDRLSVKVLHLNHADDDSDGDDDMPAKHPPKPLLVKEAIFCPPAFSPRR